MIAHYINPLFQNGYKEWELILEDINEEKYERMGKKFKDNVTIQQMEDEAKRMCKLLWDIEPNIELIIDNPGGI